MSRLNTKAIDEATINALRSHAAWCLDHLDEIVADPIARRKVRAVMKGFLSQNPHLLAPPHVIAKFVDGKILERTLDGEPEAKAVIAARKEAARITGKTASAVKLAHNRYGRRGVSKRRQLIRQGVSK